MGHGTRDTATSEGLSLQVRGGYAAEQPEQVVDLPDLREGGGGV